MTAAAERLVSKGELARIAQVSPSAISKYFERGILGPDVVAGEGQRAKIRLEPALRQIRLRRDPGQALGNGFKVRLDAPADPPASADLLAFPQPEANPVREEAAGAPRDEVADALRLAKLQREQIATRKALSDELERNGEYVRTDRMRSDMVKVLTAMLAAFEGSITDAAVALAARFELAPRDVEFELHALFRDMRTKAAEAARRAAKNEPETIEDDPLALIPAGGTA